MRSSTRATDEAPTPMIFRLYGTTYQSVDMDFDAKALNEFSFRRNRERSISADELASGYETVATHEIAEESSGAVQSETEQAMLDKVGARIEAMVAGLGDGEILVVENTPGHDYPKPRQKTGNVIVEGENRLHFDYSMAPPLRVSVRRPTS